METEELKGLKGWLILIGLGVVITPFRNTVVAFPLYFEIVRDGTFTALISPLSGYFSPSFAALLIFEMIFNFIIIALGFICIYLYFSKHYFFPKAYITIYVVSIVFILLDSWIVSLLVPETPIFDSETSLEFFRTVIAALIWTPYLLISKRVKATFVEHMPNTHTKKDDATDGTHPAL